MSLTTSAKKAPTGLDRRIEEAVGTSVEQLWERRERALLDQPSAQLADAHHGLAQAETAVTFYRVLLHRLTSGEFPVDNALFARINRAVDQLERAATTRDACEQRVLAALTPVEAAHHHRPRDGAELSAPEFAALLAIAQGAKLHHHLLTGRLSVATASGTRVAPSMLERLEEGGLAARDTSHSVQAGQPVTVTAAGRSALAGTPHRHQQTASTPPKRPGTWPSTGRAHH